MKTSIEQTTKPHRLRSLVGKPWFFRLITLITLSFFSLLTVLSFGSNRPFHGTVLEQEEPAQPALDKAATKRPVILLTGFEPFGEDRDPNPSWEGIKDLDGQQWKGYQLVCKQARVVWGAPLEQLQEWISQYRPVAVFSFGLAGRGSFALEGLASNERRKKLDNRREYPPAAAIVQDGPRQFQATIGCEALARLLSDKGYQTRVSTDAGGYLCGEALYTLEYLKSTKEPQATVLFCHVPPLETKIGDREVSAEYVQQFVKDTLDAWYTLQGVKEFIGRYFRTWSDQDMKGYDECFLPDACIQYLDSQGGLSTYSRLQFVADQRDYHRRAPVRATEVAESIDIRFEARLARVVVPWKLTAGPRTERGYDHFTLVRNQGNWRIVNLVFYTKSGEE